MTRFLRLRLLHRILFRRQRIEWQSITVFMKTRPKSTHYASFFRDSGAPPMSGYTKMVSRRGNTINEASKT